MRIVQGQIGFDNRRAGFIGDNAAGARLRAGLNEGRKEKSKRR